ncbi:YARHG domain-containing protein [Carboxylicivirga marina]|uniref:YARHG domain-containing protein n=1 Tax=Carboxylicivirga marina TaxID=2800988 RepID=A0ABS1HRB2_9BACT|nr:YARHG domain-containing protein [Carboxylicivirga marina]MBK3520050.1 YARHG domain-containing protein [Carboxylicivirga marina]
MRLINLTIIYCLVFSSAKSQDENYDSIPIDFPNNYVVDQWSPSAFDGSYVFYPDRTFVFIRGDHEQSWKIFDLGIWRIGKNEILIDIYKTVGIRGAGNIINPDCFYAANPDDYCMYEAYVKFEEWKDDLMTFEIKTLTYDYCSIDTCRKATSIEIDLNRYQLPGKYKVASCRLLKETDIAGLSTKQLRIMRNEIFARYGYSFKSEDLSNYFSSKEWYNPVSDNVDQYLTEVEKKNIKLIRKLEAK